MHIVLLGSSNWIERELPIFRQLVIGLIDETERVTQVVPAGFPDEELVSFAPRLTIPQLPRWFFRERRISRLESLIESAQELDIVHGLGTEAWEPAIMLAERFSSPVVLSVFEQMGIERLPRLLRHVESGRAAVLVASEGLERMVRPLLPADVSCGVCIPGISVPRSAVEANLASPEEVSILLSSSGEFDGASAALLEGIAKLVGTIPDVQFFVDSPPSQQHGVWKRARRLDILQHLTLIDEYLARRHVLAGLNAVVLPRATGECRSIVLRAMSLGVPVLAIEDPVADYLVDQQTAWLLRDGDAEGWRSLLERVIQNQGEAQAIGDRAREWVNTHARPSAFVQTHLDLYRQLAGKSIPFTPAQQVAEVE